MKTYILPDGNPININVRCDLCGVEHNLVLWLSETFELTIETPHQTALIFPGDKGVQQLNLLPEEDNGSG